MIPRCHKLGLEVLVRAIISLLVITAASPAADRLDIVVADFEGETYAGWTVEGEAFGTAPARGTLPGQMTVNGFLGHGLVNSFVKGDRSTGTLTSPPFAIERRYLNFLIGGGRHPGTTCLDLTIEGKVVRTATGPNDRPGGTEQLDWSAWDVQNLIGQTAVLRVVDRETGGWGHINVDQIVQSDQRQGVESARRQMIASTRYLHLPVRQDAPLRRLVLRRANGIVREFDIKLAESKPDFRVFLDLHPFEGQPLALEASLPAGSKALDQITVAGEVPESGRLYAEVPRPQFHFTSRRGWLNDPNGLVWFEGEYHLFYQHNPYGWDWGNMHWGHAVSRDLIHWTELPISLYPREYGDWCFSGSAVVDRHNTSGFGSASAPPVVAAFTSTARGECIIFSKDRGRTWTEYEGNPVVRHAGRDPRLLWHEPTKRWVMAVYDETAGARSIAFHSSSDLKKWSFESRIDGFFECPELFELEVSGDDARRRLWVLYAADGEYRLGNFDGHRFLPETGKLRLWHGNFYASQTFSDAPDGRRIQIGWGQGITFPGASFNQQMTVPCELSLRSTTEGPRLFARPVAELAMLRGKEHVFDGLTVQNGEQVLAGPPGDLLEIIVEAEVADAAAFTLNVRGTAVSFDSSKNSLACADTMAPLAPDGRVVRLRVLLDRGSIEVFGNNGRVAISRVLDPKAVRPGLSLSVPAASPSIKFRSVRVHELGSAWEKKGKLVIVGGGGMPDGIRDKFMALAGGKDARLVIIPTASIAADKKEEEAAYLEPWRKYSPARLTLLHTRSREQADDAKFARPLALATAVWFSGGDQTTLVAPYRGTSVERELKNLLGRGGAIGGTSAGAAVMSDVMIEGGNPKAKVGRGFGFISNAVFDQHFLRRNRFNRLLGVLADRPGLIGLGVDEGTALILEGDKWSVLGRSYVIACEIGKDGKPARLETFGDGDHGTFYPTGLPTRQTTD